MRFPLGGGREPPGDGACAVGCSEAFGFQAKGLEESRSDLSALSGRRFSILSSRVVVVSCSVYI